MIKSHWFVRGLINWYHENKRDLPWRNESDPYKIWLSEVILQQTQVKQGLDYYIKFAQNYPTVKHLARATEDRVLKDWQGLGYYSRARNMHFAAKSIVATNRGVFPQSFDEIRKLKGVGDYTAAAIASFAYNLPHAVVDGNVYRLLSRVFGINVPIDSGPGKKVFQQLANDLFDAKNAANYNQAIMEFGSQYCKPSKPDCLNCIFKSKCYAFANKKVSVLPVKKNKTKVENRFLNYVVLVDKNKNILLNRRENKDIWQGLFEFELIETKTQKDEKAFLNSKELAALGTKKFSVLHISKLYKHVLSHQILMCRFYVITINSLHNKTALTCKPKALTKFAFPRLIEKFLNDCNLTELL